MTTFRRFTPDEDAYLVATHGRVPIANQAMALGIDPKRVADRRRRLIRRGVLPTTRTTFALRYRPWTPDEDATVREMLVDGRSLRAIGSTINRTPLAITQRLQALKTTVTAIRNPDTIAPLSLARVGAVFGVTPAVVRDWIRLRLLKPTEPIRRHRNPPGRRILISCAAIQDFLADQAHWFLWDPARMTDADWRDEALRLRATTPYEWLDTPALADRYGYARMTVTHWFGEGRIPGATCYRRRYYVWSEHLIGWTPPADRYDAAGRQAAAMQAWETRRQQQGGRQ